MAVVSLDGRMTAGGIPGVAWASAEDQAVFRAQIAAHDRIVMGSATYLAARARIQADPEKLRVVLTRRPEQYAGDRRPGLEFTDASPAAIVARAEADGCASVLLVGGAETAARFLDAGLVDELALTLEPVIFGSGVPLVGALDRTVRLELTSQEQLNRRGTLLARYRIDRSDPPD